MKELSKEYEYRNPIELKGLASNYIKIPCSVILDDEMDNRRVAVFTFLSIYKGLNHRMYMSIPSIVEWYGYKSDTHKGGINDKFLNSLDELSDRGYVTDMTEEVKRTNCFEIEFDTQFVYDECSAYSFAILYLDEIEKIVNYKNTNLKDNHLNNLNVLLVFAFLRHAIFRTPNRLKPEEQSEEGIAGRRKRCIEAYANTYKDIAEQLGLSERTVSKAVRVLEELELIVVDETFRILNEKGEFRTPYTLFANMEKRERKHLLAKGINYARGEMERKALKIREYEPMFHINKKRRAERNYVN